MLESLSSKHQKTKSRKSTTEKKKRQMVILTLSSLALASVLVLLLPCPRVLEPDLGDPLAKARDLSDSLEVLAVRVRVQLEVRLQNLELLLREGGPHPLRFVLVVALRVASICCRTLLALIIVVQANAVRGTKLKGSSLCR